MDTDSISSYESVPPARIRSETDSELAFSEVEREFIDIAQACEFELGMLESGRRSRTFHSKISQYTAGMLPEPIRDMRSILQEMKEKVETDTAEIDVQAYDNCLKLHESRWDLLSHRIRMAVADRVKSEENLASRAEAQAIRKQKTMSLQNLKPVRPSILRPKSAELREKDLTPTEREVIDLLAETLKEDEEEKEPTPPQESPVYEVITKVVRREVHVTSRYSTEIVYEEPELEETESMDNDYNAVVNEDICFEKEFQQDGILKTTYTVAEESCELSVEQNGPMRPDDHNDREEELPGDNDHTTEPSSSGAKQEAEDAKDNMPETLSNADSDDKDDATKAEETQAGDDKVAAVLSDIIADFSSIDKELEQDSADNKPEFHYNAADQREEKNGVDSAAEIQIKTAPLVQLDEIEDAGVDDDDDQIDRTVQPVAGPESKTAPLVQLEEIEDTGVDDDDQMDRTVQPVAEQEGKTAKLVELEEMEEASAANKEGESTVTASPTGQNNLEGITSMDKDGEEGTSSSSSSSDNDIGDSDYANADEARPELLTDTDASSLRSKQSVDESINKPLLTAPKDTDDEKSSREIQESKPNAENKEPAIERERKQSISSNSSSSSNSTVEDYTNADEGKPELLTDTDASSLRSKQSVDESALLRPKERQDDPVVSSVDTENHDPDQGEEQITSPDVIDAEEQRTRTISSSSSASSNSTIEDFTNADEARPELLTETDSSSMRTRQISSSSSSDNSTVEDLSRDIENEIEKIIVENEDLQTAQPSDDKEFDKLEHEFNTLLENFENNLKDLEPTEFLKWKNEFETGPEYDGASRLPKSLVRLVQLSAQGQNKEQRTKRTNDAQRKWRNLEEKMETTIIDNNSDEDKEAEILEDLQKEYTDVKNELTERIGQVEAVITEERKNDATYDQALKKWDDDQEELDKLLECWNNRIRLKSVAVQLSEHVTDEEQVRIELEVRELLKRMDDVWESSSENLTTRKNFLDRIATIEGWMHKADQQVTAVSAAIENGQPGEANALQRLMEELHSHYPPGGRLVPTEMEEVLSGSDRALLRSTEHRLLVLKSSMTSLEEELQKAVKLNHAQMDKYDEIKQWQCDNAAALDKCRQIANTTRELELVKEQLAQVEHIQTEYPGYEAALECVEKDVRRINRHSTFAHQLNSLSALMERLEDALDKTHMELSKIVKSWTAMCPSDLEAYDIWCSVAFDQIKTIERASEAELIPAQEQLESLQTDAETKLGTIAELDVLQQPPAMRANIAAAKHRGLNLDAEMRSVEQCLQAKASLFHRMDLFKNWCEQTHERLENRRSGTLEELKSVAEDNSTIRAEIASRCQQENEYLNERRTELESKFSVGERNRVTEKWDKIQVLFDQICDVSRKREFLFKELDDFHSTVDTSRLEAKAIVAKTTHQTGASTSAHFDASQSKLDQLKQAADRLYIAIPTVVSLKDSSGLEIRNSHNQAENTQILLEDRVELLRSTLEDTQKCLENRRQLSDVLKEAVGRVADIELWTEVSIAELSRRDLGTATISEQELLKMKTECDANIYFCHVVLSRLRKEDPENTFILKQQMATLKTQILFLHSLLHTED